MDFLVLKAKELWWVILGSFKQLNIFGNGIATAHAILPQLSPLEYSSRIIPIVVHTY